MKKIYFRDRDQNQNEYKKIGIRMVIKKTGIRVVKKIEIRIRIEIAIEIKKRFSFYFRLFHH